MEVFLRVEIDMMAVIILIMISVHMRHDVSVMLDDYIFRVLIYASMVSAILDMINWIVDGQDFFGAVEILTVVNMLFFICCVYIPYLWLAYVDFRLKKDTRKLSRRNTIYRLPMFLFSLVVLTTPFTGWIFYVDEHNAYQRGPLYMLQIIISFLYLVYGTGMALRAASERELPKEKKECYTLAEFILLPVIGAFIQILFYGLPLVSICIVMSELLTFVNVQNQQICLDPLTMINNRGRLDRYLEIRTKQATKNKPLYMILLDIDKFKSINDTYGHKEGDWAIIHMANILSCVTNTYHYFLARYGGDEFVVVMESESESKVRQLLGEIAAAVEKFNYEGGKPYKISYSYGYAAFGQENINTVEALIEAADMRMYENKKRL